MKLERIDLNLLPVLDAVLRTQSVTRAAALVGLSKPAASHALARVRAQLGDPILVRAGQRWVLSERAQAMADRVSAALRDARHVLSAERPFDPRTLRREFRIHATDQMLSQLGLALGHAVTARAPHVALRFLPLAADEPAALRDQVDLALGVFHDLPPDLRTQTLFDDRFACVVRTGHKTVKGKLTLEQYLALKHVVVAPRDGEDGPVDAALAALGRTRRAVRWVPYYVSALEFAASSDCIATISERFARHHAARFDLQVLAPPFALPACPGSQVWHPRLDREPAHAWLRRLIASLVRAP
ncbi:MAG TPA: LysR family transcriptional regulator [Kofleriaceae bacterium]|nr:LysR family transcriptional regulator [Kofleriaceae bacterium]